MPARSLYRVLTALVAVSMMFGVATMGAQARTTQHPAKAPITLTIAWFAWAPANALQAMGNYYHAHVNHNVTIKLQTVPAANWYTNQFTQFTSHHPSFQIVVPDSQWLGQFSSSGFLVNLTSWIRKNFNLSSFYPYLLAAYSQYPQLRPGATGSVDFSHGHFWGVPINSDGLGWMYRKDLFNNPANKAAFKKEFGRPLTVPTSYQQILQVAKFFTRPKQGLYGVGVHESNAYDAAAEYFNETLWNYGGDLWNGKTGQIQGYINSKRAVAALTFDKQLTKYAPPGSGNWWYTEVTNAFAQGKIAMANQWWDFMPDQWLHGATKLGKTKQQIWSKMGFFQAPGAIYNGVHQAPITALGGMGAAISAFDTPQQVAASEAFLKWMLTLKAQKMAVPLGLGPSTKAFLKSAAFKADLPYATQMNASFHHLRDFWNVPDYANMLTVQGNDLNKVFTGSLSVTSALNDIASSQQKTLCTGVKLHREPNWSYCASHPNG
jgi:multiple sugar transport system substrate-binding protein